MSVTNSFTRYWLNNRLGQPVELAIHTAQAFGREYVFIAALAQHASSLIAKNAECFAFQLRELFKLDSRRFEMVELRGKLMDLQLWRWRFEWVGNSPLSPRSEFVASAQQQAQLMNLFASASRLQAGSA